MTTEDVKAMLRVLMATLFLWGSSHPDLERGLRWAWLAYVVMTEDEKQKKK